ncbi:hypothetical protein [Methylosinus sp. Ce-a6]|uniref:hypothetical protein n=1 Tax=Methylosinus sp. Ce-a6 TaxID=2172005 RepID=UPI001359B7F0|nr:hypothetical protein [Methylosinus sp. Ce-a6]
MSNVVAGGSLGGALSVLITWASKLFFHYDMESEVASAMSVMLIAIGGWIGKLTTPASQ